MRVLLEGLPPSGPHTRHTTDGHEFTQTDSLLWSVLWALWENTVVNSRAAGNKKAKMPADKKPRFPWTEATNPGQPKLAGNAGDHSQEEILDYLDNL